MNPKTLFNHFAHAIKCNDNTEIDDLRFRVQTILGVHTRMPDKTLLDLFRRKLFSESLPILPDKVELGEDILIETFGQNYEDLFRM